MEIVFLGTGGGRFNLISQARRTGGFYISGPLRLHVDPGPGALGACHDFSIDPRRTDAVVVTHNHIDHLNDAALMLEAINCFPDRKRGTLIAAKSILAGDEYGEKGISTYFIKKLRRAHVAVQGKPIRFGDYFKGTSMEHFWGVVGGMVWGIGTLSSFVAASAPKNLQVGPAISYALGQGSTMVGAFWGVVVWKEFAGGGSLVKRLIGLMFLLFVCGLAVVSIAPLFVAG